MPALLEPSATADDSDLEMLCAADYPAEPVEWLWPNRIPIGKVTLLVGDPGTGKSLVALDIASRVSQGAAWPDQPQAQGLHSLGSSPASVLILSAEDDIRDTIRPRLDAAGADPRRVFVLPSIADLRHDLEKLRVALDRLPDCRLIVIDPMNLYVVPGDSHFHTIVRRVFEPLAKLAAERGIAVLAVSHLRKHDGAAIQRAAARAVWTVCRDAVQTDRHLLLPLKNNLVENTDGLAYTITSGNPASTPGASQREDNFAPTIVWQQGAISTSAVEVLEPSKKSRGSEAEELKLAMDWLKEDLALGCKDSLFVCAEGTRCGGFRESTLRSALAALGGRTRKLGPFGDWEWYLPAFDFPRRPEGRYRSSEAADTEPKPAASDPPENLATSRTPDDSAQEALPLGEGASLRWPGARLPSDDCQPPPRCRSRETSADGRYRRWPAEIRMLLSHKSSYDRIVPHQHHLMQCKLQRILRSRKRGLKRAEIDLIRPYTFPTHCRDP